ncbi:hypothetical protein [Streptomyces sp. NPDC001568]|uniref:hypothetical protein n=1 Tax=Streptomyces sp. NPDC001568 TaxID=3364588 RepID=UPI00369866D4
MHLIEFVLSRPAPGRPSPAERDLLDALWAASRPCDGIEHIRVHASRAGARGVVFCLAADSARAALQTRALCERALAEAPLLDGWLISSILVTRP